MKWIVAAAGLLMAVFGAYWAVSGYLIVQVERGWSAVIAGAVLFSAGLLMVSIAALIAAVDRLMRTSAAALDRPRQAPEAQSLAEWPAGDAGAPARERPAASPAPVASQPFAAPFPAPPEAAAFAADAPITAPAAREPAEFSAPSPQRAPKGAAPQALEREDQPKAGDERSGAPEARNRPRAPDPAATDRVGGPLEAEPPGTPGAPPAPSEEQRESQPDKPGAPENASSAAPSRPVPAGLRPIVAPPPPRPDRAKPPRPNLMRPAPRNPPAASAPTPANGASAEAASVDVQQQPSPPAPPPAEQRPAEADGGPGEPEKTQGPISREREPEAKQAEPGPKQAEPGLQAKAKTFFQRPIGAQPKVVRQFESQGVRYTLYDDGSIDADAPGERREFASLDELRDFLEKKG